MKTVELIVTKEAFLEAAEEIAKAGFPVINSDRYCGKCVLSHLMYEAGYNWVMTRNIVSTDAGEFMLTDEARHVAEKFDRFVEAWISIGKNCAASVLETNYVFPETVELIEIEE